MLRGAKIGPGGPFIRTYVGYGIPIEQSVLCTQNCGIESGYSFDQVLAGKWGGGHPNRFIGVKFKINGQTHFGWVRLTVTVKQKGSGTWSDGIILCDYHGIRLRVGGQTIRAVRGYPARPPHPVPPARCPSREPLVKPRQRWACSRWAQMRCRCGGAKKLGFISEGISTTRYPNKRRRHGGPSTALRMTFLSRLLGDRSSAWASDVTSVSTQPRRTKEKSMHLGGLPETLVARVTVQGSFAFSG